jgi:hypothetical protein
MVSRPVIYLFAQVLGFSSCLVIGKLIYSSVLGIDIVTINSEAVARELLDKRSAIYSDRPVIPTNDLYVALVLIDHHSASY